MMVWVWSIWDQSEYWIAFGRISNNIKPFSRSKLQFRLKGKKDPLEFNWSLCLKTQILDETWVTHPYLHYLIFTWDETVIYLPLNV